MTRENFRFVSAEILEQIELLKGELEGLPNYSLKKAQKEIQILRKSANRHSVDIEIDHNGKRGHRRAMRKGLHNLEDAQRVLIQSDCSKSVEDCERCIKLAAGSILGMHNFEMPYRREEARANDSFFYYVSPEKIPGEMYSFLEFNHRLKNSVDRAVHAHYAISRIHPFTDGNGRLARLVQNTILHNAHLPPVGIQAYEKNTYLMLMREADEEFRQENGKFGHAQAKLYNYFAIKMATALKQLRTACGEK